MGDNGSVVYDLYANTESGDVCLGMTQGGITHIYNDRTIEIVGGGISGTEGGVDIFITGKQGSIVTAMENGDVRIKWRRY